MTKLMKYEFRKQMFSKVIIAVLLGVLTIYYLFGVVRGNIETAATAVGLMALIMLLSSLYLVLESMVTYERELKTKQSYMLFLVPQSTTKILGAKLLTSLLQILLTMLGYTVVAAICGGTILFRHTTVAEREQFMQMIKTMFHIQLDVSSAMNVFVAFFLMWTLIVIFGYFEITLVKTIFPKAKWTSFLVVIAYFFLLNFIGESGDAISNVILNAIQNIREFTLAQRNVILTVINILYYFVVDLALFGASAWLIDKKLSV